MEIIIIILLSAAVCFLAAKLLSVKRRIGSLSKQLDDTDASLITTQLEGDELEDVVLKINKLKENEHNARLAVGREQDSLKQAISDISHDIRTPLTSLTGYLQLAERSAESEEQKTNIGIALERARYCTALVNDFFELSLVDSKGLEPVIEKVDVNDTLCESILANFPNFEAANITPHYEDSGKPIYVRADRKMLTRVIQNLISNGIKYGRERLDISLTEEDNSVKISFANPAADKDIDTRRIFEKFYQSGKSRTAGGAGIGLYVCKQFITAMSGSIEAAVRDGVLIITIALMK